MTRRCLGAAPITEIDKSLHQGSRADGRRGARSVARSRDRRRLWDASYCGRPAKHNVAGADPFLAEELRLIAPPTAQNKAQPGRKCRPAKIAQRGSGSRSREARGLYFTMISNEQPLSGPLMPRTCTSYPGIASAFSQTTMGMSRCWIGRGIQDVARVPSGSTILMFAILGRSAHLSREIAALPCRTNRRCTQSQTC
jgi:hypothetical protein